MTATNMLRSGKIFILSSLHHRTEKRADAGSQRHRQSAPDCYAGRGLQDMGTTSLRSNVSQHSQKGE